MSTLLAEALPRGKLDLDDYHLAIDRVAVEAGVPLFRAAEMDDVQEYFADLYHMNGYGTQVLGTS